MFYKNVLDLYLRIKASVFWYNIFKKQSVQQNIVPFCNYQLNKQQHAHNKGVMVGKKVSKGVFIAFKT